MTTLATTTFEAAEEAYVLANTPLFLLRKLKHDPRVVALAHSESPEQLFDALTTAVTQTPVTLADKLRPFILLIALGIKGELSRLTQALNLTAPAKPEWFNYICRVLIETSLPTTRTTLKTPEIMATSSASLSLTRRSA